MYEITVLAVVALGLSVRYVVPAAVRFTRAYRDVTRTIR